MSEEVFVELWNRAETFEDACRSIAEYARSHGFPDLPKVKIAARVAEYRMRGLELKRQISGRRGES
jgi:hypothetical protein